MTIDWKRRAEKAVDEIIRLTQALRDAANANGAPIPDYYAPESQIKYYQGRSAKVAAIIAEGLKKSKDFTAILKESK